MEKYTPLLLQIILLIILWETLMKNSYSALTTKQTYPAKCMHQASDQLLINERTCKFAAFLSKLSTKLQKIFGNASGQIIIYSTKTNRKKR